MSETTNKSKRPKLSSREQKRQARQALKSARSGRSSGLDALLNNEDDGEEDNNNDDVYEQMTEEEYRQYVERKREREDFVVDDGTFFFIIINICCVCRCMVHVMCKRLSFFCLKDGSCESYHVMHLPNIRLTLVSPPQIFSYYPHTNRWIGISRRWRLRHIRHGSTR